MDNLTHTAVGLFLYRAGLGREAPHARWILLLAANIPDIDVVSAAGGALGYLDYHRHLTHSLLLLPLMALLPVALVRLCVRRPLHWGRAWAISAAGVMSHLALDLTNVYGVRLLAPLSPRWFGLDLVSVVDLWVWAVCLLAILAPIIARLVNAEIGGKARQAVPGRGFAIFALVFLVLYGGVHEILHVRAMAVLDSRLYDGVSPLRVAAFPGPANPFRWRGIVETFDFYGEYDLNLLGEFDPAGGRRLYKPVPGGAISAARRTRTFQDFLAFAQYPLWRATALFEPQAGTRVDAMDLRFGTPERPGFVATAILDEKGALLRSWFSFSSAGPR